MNSYASGVIMESVPSHLDLYRIYKSDEPDIVYSAKIKSTPADEFKKFIVKMEEEISEICVKHRIKYRKIVYKADDMHEVIFLNDDKVYPFCLSFEINVYGSEIVANFCCSTGTADSEIGQFLIDFLDTEIDKIEVNHTSKVYIIYKDDYGLSLKPFKIKKSSNSSLGIKDLYNADFIEVAGRIEEALSANTDEMNSNGITLLHGDVGTGKTSYLRHLIRTLNKKIIYLPPDLSTEISSPAFISFLMEHPNSILIIEDAETVLKTREAGGNQAVSNILNMSDGILGDALSLQILCTFNADIGDIDKALLREGRLVEIYSFTALSNERTINLYKKLYERCPPKDRMTLAQIFNDEQYSRNIKKGVDKPKFGFI